MTALPSGSTESPLVIDLPDGQKLVVGNIPNGTVIEVATWRGTGRPDSRTNRMMLGVSNAEIAITKENELENSAQSPIPASIPKYMRILNPLKQFIFWLFKKESKSNVVSAKKENLSSSTNSSPGMSSRTERKKKLPKIKKFSLLKMIQGEKKEREKQEQERANDKISQETSEWLETLLGKSVSTASTPHPPESNLASKKTNAKKSRAASKKPSGNSKNTSKKKKR